MWAEWWVWGLAALALGVVEMLAPAQVFLGFAIGAGAVSGLLWLDGLGWLTGLLGGREAAGVALVFAVASLVAWLGLRAVLGPARRARVFEDDVND